jgi:hypothetical protein
VHSTCPWYIKCKLGYNKKQKSKAIKQVANAIKFDETFYYERWDQKEVLALSVWKEKNKLKHVAVASVDLQCPASKQYPSCTYELKTELFPVGSAAGADGLSPRARANTALEGDGVDASKPCGEITITVTHVPGNTRWQQHQASGGVAGDEAAVESKLDHADSQQSKKAELMKAAAEHKAEKDKADQAKEDAAKAEAAKAEAAKAEGAKAEAAKAEAAKAEAAKAEAAKAEAAKSEAKSDAAKVEVNKPAEQAKSAEEPEAKPADSTKPAEATADAAGVAAPAHDS